MTITECNNCPCLNTDQEHGVWCNLGYDLVKFRGTHNTVSFGSPECKLVSIITEEETISRPPPVVIERLLHGMA
ncbi:MAG TPA: hypothetical protein ENG14_05105 [Thermodesulforhabdus norvegica]|uniref:Uncharacterized protein n=1 Tax=Thermodesulforhabdus norvegica TaxID=39841 RepID=A0A7C1AYQ9_9BACT|nr:hypothetical protein [Thermodesulforhabdus norvegica]